MAFTGGHPPSTAMHSTMACHGHPQEVTDTYTIIREHNPGPISFNNHQPAHEDLHNRSDTEMKTPSDAADAGKFLRRQVKSPGNSSTSKKFTFLEYEHNLDLKTLNVISKTKPLKKKAPAKTSITAALIRNKLLLDEDTKAGECSRYQCQRPKICFQARKAKQEAGWSLYDSWKCYKPRPRWGQ